MQQVPNAVWQTLTCSLGLDFNLRRACLSSALVAAGYITEGLRYAKEFPWSLVQGDADVRLEELSSQECPAEETAKKIWLLLKMGFDRQVLKRGLAVMKEAAHSALTTEQAHAAGSIMMKAHKMYGDATMRDRALVYQARPLLVESPLEKELQEACAQLDSIKTGIQTDLGRNKHMFLNF